MPEGDGLNPYERHRQRTIDRANIPVSWTKQGRGLEDFRGLGREKIDGFIKDCVSGKNWGQGMLLRGVPGTGKTTAAIAAMVEILKRAPFDWLNKGDYFPLRPGYYIKHNDFVGLHHKSFGNGAQAEEAEELLDSLYHRNGKGSFWHRNCKILVLDDTGKENPLAGNGHKKQVMHDILRSRYERGAPTIITTNLEPEAWGAVYDEAVSSFLNEAFPTTIEMTKVYRRGG